MSLLSRTMLPALPVAGTAAGLGLGYAVSSAWLNVDRSVHHGETAPGKRREDGP